jgi:hypothetical protein
MQTFEEWVNEKYFFDKTVYNFTDMKKAFDAGKKAMKQEIEGRLKKRKESNE